MTSRDRVRITLSHKEPDRVPIDIWGSASRINTDLYIQVAKALGLKQLGDVIRPGSDTEYEDYALSDLLGSDFRHINIGKPSQFKSYQNEKGYIIDEWGIGRSIVGRYPTIVYHPMKGMDESDLDQYTWPTAKDPGRIAKIGEKAEEYFNTTDKAISATSANSGQFFDICQYLRGTEDFFTDLYDEEDFARKLIDKVTDYLIELNLYYLKPIAPYIEWVEFSSDFGAQHAPFISVSMFRNFFKEPFKRLFGEIKHAYPNVKIFLHSCGSVFDLIAEFIDCGVDIMNPIQPLAMGMDSRRLKEAYGNEVVFHGGIDIQRAINGSLQDVRNETALRIDSLARGGGYILSTANHIQEGAPIENVISMFRYAQEIGVYPIKQIY